MSQLKHIALLPFTLAISLLAAVQGAGAQEDVCPDGESHYRQDVDNATGWNQLLPVPDEEAATVRFFGMMEMEMTINGETTVYNTIGGGTGIRTRAAIHKDPSIEESRTYAFYELPAGQGPYDHFLIVDGDLYWPTCR